MLLTKKKSSKSSPLTWKAELMAWALYFYPSSGCAAEGAALRILEGAILQMIKASLWQAVKFLQSSKGTLNWDTAWKTQTWGIHTCLIVGGCVEVSIIPARCFVLILCILLPWNCQRQTLALANGKKTRPFNSRNQDDSWMDFKWFAHGKEVSRS